MKTRLKIPNSEIRELLGSEPISFPKYATQIINLANQNAQGTRPAVVGQMSDLIQEFRGECLEEWKDWYLKVHPDAIKNASEKISKMVDNLRAVMNQIDQKMIEDWVEDLVIVKTYIGLKFQEAILAKIANILNVNYKLSAPDQESKGIDGYIDSLPVSIKPDSYTSKKSLQEQINVSVIYYKKTKDGLSIDFTKVLQALNQ